MEIEKIKIKERENKKIFLLDAGERTLFGL